jgi:hypothetical protein
MMMGHFRRRAGSQPVALFCAVALLSVLVACGDGAEPEADFTTDETPVATAMDTRPAPRILEPSNGAELDPGPLRVVLEADNITIVPAGDMTPNSGHHHLFLNADGTAEGQPVPADQTGVIHLGQGQSEYTFENVVPGEYTLIALIGDATHMVIPQVADTVTFTVLVPGE